VAIYQQSGQHIRAVGLAKQLLERQPRNAGLHVLHGQNLAAAGSPVEARKAFEAALAAAPGTTSAAIGLAGLDAESGQPNSAEARLNAVLSQHKDHVDAMLAMAALSERGTRLVEAQRWLERADDSAGPNNIQAGLALVEFHLRHGRQEGARSALDRLTGKAPDTLPVLVAAARVYAMSGDNPGARTALSRASTLAGFEVPTLMLIARLQQQVGHVAGAVQSTSKVLTQRPKDLDAQVLMAELELAGGELVKAEQRARDVIAAHPRAGAGHLLLGDIATTQGRHAVALEAYRKAQQVQPSSRHVAQLFAAQSRSDASAARQLAARWLDKNPADAAVRRMLADFHAQRNELPAAKLQYQALLKQRPDDAEAMNNLANVLLLAGESGALPLAERAMALKPGAPHLIGTAGWAAFKAGQVDRALQLLRDARLRDPANAHTRYFLGAVLAASGRHAEARTELQAAIKGGEGQAFASDADHREQWQFDLQQHHHGQLPGRCKCLELGWRLQ
jgi:putative PEP-CTERM system TPR-repeat lipoprotein